jgi:hypothetical protein
MRSRMTALGAVSERARCANRLPASAVAASSLAAVLPVCVAAPAPAAMQVGVSAPFDRLARRGRPRPGRALGSRRPVIIPRRWPW